MPAIIIPFLRPLSTIALPSTANCVIPFTISCSLFDLKTHGGTIPTRKYNTSSTDVSKKKSDIASILSQGWDFEEARSCSALESCKYDDKHVKCNRKQKVVGTSFGRNPDLLTIPGVGPRNFRKFMEKGIEGVSQLKQLYKNKFSGNTSDKMVEYLRNSVGIMHRNHAESITRFIKASIEEEEEVDVGGKAASERGRVTLCVEGNISVGKTTFLQRVAKETLELRDLVDVIPEPVNKWQDVGPSHFNILDAFYAQPQRYAYTFQNYVFVTRVLQEKESSSGIKPLRLMERSVFSDRMVFARAVHKAKWMNEMEMSIYNSWFDPVVSCLPGIIPDGFIYLRASPGKCHTRLKLRNRSEEGGVTLEYLHHLHEMHESWLFPADDRSLLSPSEPPPPPSPHCPLLSLPPDIRDRVFFLEGAHLHPGIQKVPALVLDCETDLDFSRDIDAKVRYANQVAAFFKFVKRKKESGFIGGDKNRADVGSKCETTSPPSNILKHKGLWMALQGTLSPDSTPLTF